MTAIAGIFNLDSSRPKQSTVDRVKSSLSIYGKDAQDCLVRENAAFVRTLLRTTPEDVFDRQPLIDVKSGSVLVFDGRIDNREELIETLSLDSADAKRLPDSEIVMRACLKWANGVFKQLIGDFALIFLCGKTRIVIFGR